MTAHLCPQCGARYSAAGDSCEARFNALLALDHSHTEPWGSRHGMAFAVFTLQHPAGKGRDVLERCWIMLHRIIVAGDDPQAVARALRRVNEGGANYLTAPPLPPNVAEPKRFSITIVDMGEFDPDRYASLLTDWCRTTLATLEDQTAGA